jgi:hypothetical protein
MLHLLVMTAEWKTSPIGAVRFPPQTTDASLSGFGKQLGNEGKHASD